MPALSRPLAQQTVGIWDHAAISPSAHQLFVADRAAMVRLTRICKPAG